MTTTFYTKQELRLIDMLKIHPKSTISEMKMHVGLKERREVPHALNGLRVKGALLHTADEPPRYSLSNPVV